MWLCGLVLVFLVPFTLVANELSPLCTRVVHVDTCDGTLWLAWEVDVKPGDSVIIYQSQGALQDAEGKPDTSGGAGRWSVHEVLSRNGSSVQLSSIPVAYPLEGSVQLCPVIYGTHVTIIEPHTVRPWNDGANGVLMISADTLTISAAIDAVGSGFPGGRASMNSWDTSRTDAMADWTSGIGGGRGLGIAVMGHDKAAGRLSSCNGGGGGNARNAGGGGGAGAGRGGRGGHQTSEYGSEPVGGMGGHALIPNSAAQVWLGGGGGGGHQNDFLGADGGAGGGLVILRARYLRWMRGATIQAGGESAATAIGDGAGGGGGGGGCCHGVGWGGGGGGGGGDCGARR